MRMLGKLTLIAFASSLLLAAAIGVASARNISTTNQNIRVTWSSLEFKSEGIATIISCPVTMEGSLHRRTIAKAPGSLIGAITRARVKQEACVNGRIAAFNGVETYNGTAMPTTLPWHLTYNSFVGSLPAIEAVRLALQRFRFGITLPGLCTAQVGNETDAIVSSARLEESAIVDLAPLAGSNRATVIRRDAGIACPATGEARGIGTVSLLGATTRISLTLI